LNASLFVALVGIVLASVVPNDLARYAFLVLAGAGTLTAMILAGRRLRRLSASLDETTRRLLALEDTDDVTGLASRAAFERAIEAEAARAKRAEERFAVLRADLRGLSRLAPPAQQAALRWFATLISRQTRNIDTRARLSTDAFGVIVVGADSRTATKVVERIRSQTPPAGVEVAFGIATYPQDGEEPPALLARAEEELAVTATSA
jgi:diguanylate cyclase (GGDEF)-like protein